MRQATTRAGLSAGLSARGLRGAAGVRRSNDDRQRCVRALVGAWLAGRVMWLCVRDCREEIISLSAARARTRIDAPYRHDGDQVRVPLPRQPQERLQRSLAAAAAAAAAAVLLYAAAVAPGNRSAAGACRTGGEVLCICMCMCICICICIAAAACSLLSLCFIPCAPHAPGVRGGCGESGSDQAGMGGGRGGVSMER